MVRDVELIDYLPPFMQEYQEVKEALNSENTEFKMLWNAANKVLLNEFIETADEYGIGRFEKELGILPYKEDTLESRRARVHSRWFISIPYTMKSFLAKLIALCGEHNFTLTKQFCVYHMEIEMQLGLFGQVEELERLIGLMIPCNLVVTLHNKIKCYAEGKICMASGGSFTHKFFITNDEKTNQTLRNKMGIAQGMAFAEVLGAKNSVSVSIY